jgi:hypothetical protein
MSTETKRPTEARLPHSWGINSWPETVWPHEPKRARYVVRANLNALLQVGAISRVGRELVLIGDRYSRWLDKNASRVPDYRCNANGPEVEGAIQRGIK